MIYISLFTEFFKVGLFCFGGAFGMIPLIREVVLAHSWMNEDAFYNLIGVCESTPGPIAVNMATYIGAGQAGLSGSIIATAGVVLPSFLIICLIASVLSHLTEHPCFKAVMSGVKPVIVALILTTGIQLLLRNMGIFEMAGIGRDGNILHMLDGRAILILGLLLVLELLYRRITHKKPGAVKLIIAGACLGLLV